MDENKESAGLSPADVIYGQCLPGSRMAEAVKILKSVSHIENYETYFKEEMIKLDMSEHVGELLMRVNE